jgi:hypothetical protein
LVSGANKQYLNFIVYNTIENSLFLCHVVGEASVMNEVSKFVIFCDLSRNFSFQSLLGQLDVPHTQNFEKIEILGHCLGLMCFPFSITFFLLQYKYCMLLADNQVLWKHQYKSLHFKSTRADVHHASASFGTTPLTYITGSGTFDRQNFDRQEF